MNLLIKLRILGVITVIVLFIATYAYAKTASQVFEAVSPSIVIILTLDTNGDTKGFGSGVVLRKELSLQLSCNPRSLENTGHTPGERISSYIAEI